MGRIGVILANDEMKCRRDLVVGCRGCSRYEKALGVLADKQGINDGDQYNGSKKVQKGEGWWKQ